MENIPKTLYRGVVIGYEQLKDFQFSGVDLVPYGEPIIDENGRKLIGDGNEFGIYMTDNQTMVYSAYGRVHHNSTRLSNTIRFGNSADFISIPDIGICYQISTEGINVRKPWISSILKGHYNNGFEGTEYIADYIPSKNVTVTRIQIGSDFLHDEEFIDSSDILTAEEITRKKIEERKARLEELLKALSKLTPIKRSLLNYNDKNALIDIYGENGVKYIDYNSIDISNSNGMLKSLLFHCYHSDPDNLDFTKLGYLEQLKKRLASTNNSDSIHSLLQLIQSDIDSTLEKQNNFIKRKEEQGETPNISAFQNKTKMLQEFETQIIHLQKEKKDTQEEKKKNEVLKMIESLLQIRITPIKGYAVDPNKFGGVPYAQSKSLQELIVEQGQIFQSIDKLYTDGTIDFGTSKIMKKVIMDEYQKMEQNANQIEESHKHL